MNWRRLVDSIFRRDLDARSPAVSTVISVIYTTAPKTFDGPAIYVTAGAPIVQSRVTVTARPTPTPTDSEDEEEETTTTAKTSARSQAKPTSSASSIPASQLLTQVPSTLITSSAALSTTAASTTTTSPLTRTTMSTSSRSSATRAAASATAEPVAKSGMSGGAIAGLIFGLLIGLGLIIGAILWFNKRQKAKLAAARRLDDEKAMSSRANAPRINPAAAPMPLASNSQFSSNFGNNAASNIPTTATFPVDPPRAAAQQPASAWERPGANNSYNDPANPFGTHAETLNNSPPRNGLEPSIPNVNASDFPLPATSNTSSAPRLPELDGIDSTGSFTSESGVNGAPSSMSAGEVAAAGLAAGAVAGAAGAVAAANGSPAKPAEQKVHRVQMDFHPSMEDELAIRGGQLVKVQHEYDDGWALVSYMDGSRSGVVPRTCLSKHSLQPRPKNGPPPMNGRPGPNGPGMRGPPGQGRQMSPAGGRGPGSRPQSPYGRNSPGPFNGPGGRPQSPYGPGSRSGSPGNMGGRGRSGSASAGNGNGNGRPYSPYGPGQGRSMSPGPYGAGGLRPTPRPDNMRRRSNSMGQMDSRRMMQQGGGGPNGGGMPVRKPVGGMD